MKWTWHETQLPFHIILIWKYNSYLQTIEYIYNEKDVKYKKKSPRPYPLGDLWVCIRVLLHGVNRNGRRDMTVQRRVINRGNYMMTRNKGPLGRSAANMADRHVLTFERPLVVGAWKTVLNSCLAFDVCICIFCFGTRFSPVLKSVWVS